MWRSGGCRGVSKGENKGKCNDHGKSRRNGKKQVLPLRPAQGKDDNSKNDGKTRSGGDNGPAASVFGCYLALEEVWLFGDWGERDAAEDFGETGFTDDGEFFASCFGGVGVVDVVDDGDKAVGIGSLISATADGRGDAVEGDVAEDVDGAGEVADAVGCGRPGQVGHGVIAGWVVVDCVGDAELEAGLQ